MKPYLMTAPEMVNEFGISRGYAYKLIQQMNEQLKAEGYLDNDRTGRRATRCLIENLSEQYEVIDDPPPRGKDVNDFLCFRKGISRETNAVLREKG